MSIVKPTSLWYFAKKTQCLLLSVFFFLLYYPSECEVIAPCSFDLISFMASGGNHLFMCLSAICISSLEKCLFKYFANFKNLVIILLLSLQTLL